MNNIIIEVGVNDGREIPKLLERFPDCSYYGFEPLIELYSKLIFTYSDNPRVNLFPIAISNYNGFSKFNVAALGDWGCSSLFKFSDNIHTIWPNRSDFNMTHSYNVPIMKMSTFLQNYISTSYTIKYAWIDAQGSDIDVLVSFDECIQYLEKGRIEVAQKTELYKDTKNNINNAIDFLKTHNFKYDIFDDPFGGREADIEFYR
jgi:FkbM family methyltransferase